LVLVTAAHGTEWISGALVKQSGTVLCFLFNSKITIISRKTVPAAFYFAKGASEYGLKHRFQITKQYD
jgi:hypothetical protein